jgi:hypothetical protein
MYQYWKNIPLDVNISNCPEITDISALSNVINLTINN